MSHIAYPFYLVYSIGALNICITLLQNHAFIPLPYKKHSIHVDTGLCEKLKLFFVSTMFISFLHPLLS